MDNVCARHTMLANLVSLHLFSTDDQPGEQTGAENCRDLETEDTRREILRPSLHSFLSLIR